MTATRDQEGRDLTLLVWDAPNVNCTLQRLYRTERLSRSQRPDASMLRRWVCDRAGAGTSEAIVFASTYDQDRLDGQRGWLTCLRRLGYGVFVRPKDADGNGDIDDDMVAAVHVRQQRLREVIVMSQDLRNFAALATTLTALGVIVTPLVVEGFKKWPPETDPVDLSAIPGLFAEPVPLAISRFEDIPRAGRFFAPVGMAAGVEAAQPDSESSESPTNEVANSAEPRARAVILGASTRQLRILRAAIDSDMARSVGDELAVSVNAPWWWQEANLSHEGCDPLVVIRAALRDSGLTLVESPTGPIVRRDRLASVVDLRDRRPDAASG